MIYNLHLLRAVAALAVVYYHITSQAGLNLRASFGKFGVDIFFVISGFIIAYIGSRDSRSFLVRRLIRVVPFYWSATLFVFCIAWASPHLLRQTRPDVAHLLFSLFFIPHETSYSGNFPTLLLGWTLNYEMFFYLLFAVAIVCSQRHAPLVCSGILTIAVCAINALGTDNSILKFYGRPIVLEFVLGIGIFYTVSIIERSGTTLREISWFKWLLYLLSLTALVLLALQEVYGGFGLPHLLSAGLPALTLVCCAVLIERVYSVRVNHKLILLLGESSYILYLVHPYVIYGILRLLLRTETKLGIFSILSLIVMLLILTSTIAIAIHIWFEKPIMVVLRKILVPLPDLEQRSAAKALVLQPGLLP